MLNLGNIINRLTFKITYFNRGLSKDEIINLTVGDKIIVIERCPLKKYGHATHPCYYYGYWNDKPPHRTESAYIKVKVAISTRVDLMEPFSLKTYGEKWFITK